MFKTTALKCKNQISELCCLEFKSPIGSGTASGFSLLANLAFGRGHIEVDRVRVPLSLSSARLNIVVSGGEPIHDTAFGRIPLPAVEDSSFARKVTEEHQRNWTWASRGEGRLNVRGEDVFAAIGGGLERASSDKKSEHSMEQRYTEKHIFDFRTLYYLNRWEFKEINQKYLNGTYVAEENGPIIAIACHRKRVQVKGVVQCEPYEIRVDYDNINWSGKTFHLQKYINKKKIISALVAKILRNRTENEDSRIVFSEAEIRVLVNIHE